MSLRSVVVFDDDGDGVSSAAAEGSGATPVDQLRPAFGWRCRCSLFRFSEAANGTSFGVEQMRDLVWSSRGREQSRRRLRHWLLLSTKQGR